MKSVEPYSDSQIWKSFRSFSKTFSSATLLLPREVRMPIATLYAFCRRVDDLADQDPSGLDREAALTELDDFERSIRRIISDNEVPKHDPLWPRIARINDDWHLSIAPFLELIDGARFDLNGEKIDSMEDLLHYSNLVAGSVGSMMLPFLISVKGFFDEWDFEAACDEIDQPARDLGVAMQITNILRDVGEDLRQLDRVYIPNTSMVQYGISIDQLRSGQITEPYTELLESLMSVAEEKYISGLLATRRLRRRVQPGIRSAARMYREIMNELRLNQYDNLNRRAYTSSSTKLALTFKDNYESRKSSLAEMKA